MSPVEAAYRNAHHAIPGAVEGYELAPGENKGLWSIVSPTGTVLNLNNLGLQILAYIGAGMPPIENVSTPYGLLGGSLLQKTLIRPRTITLTCIVQATALQQIQRLKTAIINQVSPYNSLQSSKGLALRYQLVNYCGDLIGTTLEVPVTFAGDLSGNTTNLYQDRFDLSFIEFNPPSIKELTPITVPLNYAVSRAASQGIRYKSPTTGAWSFISLAVPILAKYDQVGNLWYGSTTVITNRAGTTSQAHNSSTGFLTMAADINNNVFVGGAFTSPTNYIMVYNGSTWAVPFISSGSPINGTVKAMAFGNDGALYIAGSFTVPGTSFIKYTYGPLGSVGLYTSIGGLPSGLVFCMVKGLDGNIYIGGDSFVMRYNPTTNVMTNITGGINGPVKSLVALPDGRIVAGGSWAFASYPYVAAWNGTAWLPLGNGLNADVASLGVDKVTGAIYATGAFTASGPVNLPGGTAQFNGSNWVAMDINNVVAPANPVNLIDIRSSDGELAMAGPNGGAATLINSAMNTVTYAGTADVSPQVKFTGPGTIYSIANYRTGKSISFYNYTLLAGETALYTYNPADGLSFVSNFYNDVQNKLLPGGDRSQFSLLPGDNYIVPFMTGTTGASKVELIYQNVHYSFEAGAV